MRVELHHQVPVNKSLEKAIAHKVEKIGKRLKRYHPEVADLEIKLGPMENGNDFECQLILKAFKETLNAKKSAPDLRVAVDKCFDALLKELEHYRFKLNKSLQASI